jgi:hypothetical protein
VSFREPSKRRTFSAPNPWIIGGSFFLSAI